MAFDAHDSDEEVIATINIVPFVDIVLVLLIIFMLTSAAIIRASIEVDLPRAASAGAGVNSTLNLVLTQDGTLYLNGEPTDADSLAGYVAREAAKEEDLQAVISADTKVDYGAVVKVIDLVKSNGVKAFALNLQRDM